MAQILNLSHQGSHDSDPRPAVDFLRSPAWSKSSGKLLNYRAYCFVYDLFLCSMIVVVTAKNQIQQRTVIWVVKITTNKYIYKWL